MHPRVDTPGAGPHTAGATGSGGTTRQSKTGTELSTTRRPSSRGSGGGTAIAEGADNSRDRSTGTSPRMDRTVGSSSGASADATAAASGSAHVRDVDPSARSSRAARAVPAASPSVLGLRLPPATPTADPTASPPLTSNAGLNAILNPLLPSPSPSGLGLGQPPPARRGGRAPGRSRGASNSDTAAANGGGLLRFGFTRVVTPTGSSTAATTAHLSPSSNVRNAGPGVPPAFNVEDDRIKERESDKAKDCTPKDKTPPPPSSRRHRSRLLVDGYVEYVPVHNATPAPFKPFVPTPSPVASNSPTQWTGASVSSSEHAPPPSPPPPRASPPAPDAPAPPLQTRLRATTTTTISTSAPTPPSPTPALPVLSASSSSSSPAPPPPQQPLETPQQQRTDHAPSAARPSVPSAPLQPVIINLASPPASSPLTPGCLSEVAPSPAPDSFTPASTAPKPPKGKGRAEPERRVLPARIRRAAGAGAEAVRELEEMIVDWLERFGDINSNPPNSLPIRITTLSLDLLRPQAYLADEEQPTASSSDPVKMEVEPPSAEQHDLIETPSWVLVKAGEDDKMEAREELTAGPNRSPSKRLRHGVIGSQLLEDTSDAYYEGVHRKMEAFERRQRIREIDQLKFMRHKMNARIDLLRTLQPAQWNTVVNNVLARAEPNNAWARGRRKLDVVGIDWLRRRLVREGVELLKRYDQLLPGTHDQKKQRLLDTTHMSSPSLASSASPPPSRRATTPAEDDPPRKRGRLVKSNHSQETVPATSSRRQSYQASKPPSTAGHARRSKRTREVSPTPSEPSSLSDPESSPPSSPDDYEPEPEPVRAAPTPIPKLRLRLVAPITPTPAPTPPAPAVRPRVILRTNSTPKPATPTAETPKQVMPKAAKPPKPATPATPSQPAARIPMLLEAARRREEAHIDTPSPKRAARPARQQTRASTRLSGTTSALLDAIKANPFGMPLPPALDIQADFALDKREFGAIIAARSRQHVPLPLGMQTGANGNGTLPALAPLPPARAPIAAPGHFAAPPFVTATPLVPGPARPTAEAVAPSPAAAAAPAAVLHAPPPLPAVQARPPAPQTPQPQVAPPQGGRQRGVTGVPALIAAAVPAAYPAATPLVPTSAPAPAAALVPAAALALGPTPARPTAIPARISPAPPTTGSNDTEDEMRDMEGVEASVLNADGTDGSDSC